MCGIADMIEPTLGREEGETLLERMLWPIRHRGPARLPLVLGRDACAIGTQPAEHHRLERTG